MQIVQIVAKGSWKSLSLGMGKYERSTGPEELCQMGKQKKLMPSNASELTKVLTIIGFLGICPPLQGWGALL